MKNIQKKLLLPLAILIGLIPLANPLNIFNDLRLFAFDTLQQMSPRKPLANDPVVIIDIDERAYLNNFSNKYKEIVARPSFQPKATPINKTTNVCIVIGTG